MELAENIDVENKPTLPDEPRWAWDMVRSSAALYNSGGGVLRVGLNDDTSPSIRRPNPKDFTGDGSCFSETLFDYLNPVPQFTPVDIGHCIEITFHRGVTFPSLLRKILSKPLSSPKDKSNQSYPEGTIFMRKMDGGKPGSVPPKTASDWHKLLTLWEANRGVALQAPLLAQFSLLVNKWNPFDEGNTELTLWEMYCIADAAGMLGRPELCEQLKSIASKVVGTNGQNLKTKEERNAAGAQYKRPLCSEIEDLSRKLFGLGIPLLPKR